MPGRRRFDCGRRDLRRTDRSPTGAERFDAEAPSHEPLRPAIRVETCLRHQAADECASVGDLAPDARQEQRAASAGLKHEAIAVGLERVGEFGLASRRNRPRVGEDRDVEAKPGEFGLAERLKARVGKARLDRIGDRILEERSARLG